MDYTCTYHDIFNIVCQNFQLSLDAQLNVLEEKIATTLTEPFSIDSDYKNKLKKLICKIKSKWEEAYRKTDVFLRKNENWLQTSTTILVINVKILKKRIELLKENY